MSSIKISQIEDLVSGDVYDVDTLTVALDSISSLEGFAPVVDKTAVVVKGYHTTNDGGAGIFVWDAAEDKANHNGGTIIDPSKTFPADWSDQTALQSWFTGDGLGAGCWKRVYDGAVNVKWFGDTSFELVFNQAANVQQSVEVPAGTYTLDGNTIDFTGIKFHSFGTVTINTNTTLTVTNLVP